MTNKRTTSLASPLPNSLTTNRFHMNAGYDFAPVTRVCNASSKKPLELSLGEPARPGAQDFRRYRSFGQGC